MSTQVPTRPLLFYIVFHKEIQNPLDNFTEADKRSMIRWVAVNEQIEKQIPASIPKDCILREWEFADYCPFYQISGIRENSLIHHFVHNPDLLYGSKYVGIGQYDMKLNVDMFRSLQKELTTMDGSCAFLPFHMPILLLFDGCLPDFWIECVIQPYNIRYGTHHNLKDIFARHTHIPLINCFILTSELWKEMAEFSRYVTPFVIKGLKHSLTHLAGTLERAHGLFLLFAIDEKRIDRLYAFPAIEHHS
jgi:hypothetical protein